MPPPISSPSNSSATPFQRSHNAIILVAVVERGHSRHIKHAISPYHPPDHPVIVTAQTALTAGPDFIFPPYITPPEVPSEPLESWQPTAPKPQHAPTTAPIHTARTLPLASSSVYLALAEPASDPSRASFKLPRPPRSSLPRTSRTFSNLSSTKTPIVRRPTILRRPTSSPPPRLSSIGFPVYIAPAMHQSLSTSSSTDTTVSDDECVDTSLESSRRQFRTTLLTSRTHAFAITAKDALEHAAATYAHLVDDALSDPTDHSYRATNLSNRPFIRSSLVADNIMRCPPSIAKELTEALLASLNHSSPVSCKDLVSNNLNPLDFTCDLTLSAFITDQEDIHNPATDTENTSTPGLTLTTASSALSASGPRTLKETSDPVPAPDPWQDSDPRSFWNSAHDTSSSDRNTPVLPWEAADARDCTNFAVERAIELADVTLLLSHFSVRSLVSVIVALLEESRVCLVGPNTALVSRAVLALDNLVRPFKWPHLISPILVAHFLPVLGAPFPYLVGILEDHFPAARELPLENVVFADLSSGKVTTVEGPRDLYRHIPRRIRGRLERRLARAKVACTRQVLRSRSMLFSPAVSNTATSLVEVDHLDESAKKDKPSLLKRSRSFARFGEVTMRNIWLDHETVAMIDKAMRKFFAELLEGLFYTFEADNHANFDQEIRLDGPSQLRSPMTNSVGTSVVSSKRDSDKRYLAMSFQQTQMFMQWRDEDGCDPLFGTGNLDTESQSKSMSRKRSKHRDSSFHPKKTDAGPGFEDDITLKTSKFRTCVTSDVEDIYSGDDVQTGETGVVRKRFRSKRGRGRRQGVRPQLSADADGDQGPVQDVSSDIGKASRSTLGLSSASERNAEVGLDTTAEREPESGSEAPSRRPWLSIRLPSSPWTTAREWTTSSWKEEEMESEIGEPSDGDEETDAFDETEDNIRIQDVLPTEEVGTSWTRMRHWSRRKNRDTARA